ncbi:MAG: ribonuclease HII [Desulfovibrio sp.]|jgi:ribonuclease HII|nr:ribonuclease HII [Desulfovibrio sp.]
MADRHIAGIDEAGRGCLAGPVVAGAVIWPRGHEIAGLTDSKLLSARAREILAPQIKCCAVAWGLGLVWPDRIDSINILQATFEAMSRAVRTLGVTPDGLLIDGDKTLPEVILDRYWRAGHTGPCPEQKALVGGDKVEPSISAASILAKIFRDRLMRALARRWPGYGFEFHKGYGTTAHYAALRRLGPSPQHRLTFRGVQGEKCSGGKISIPAVNF